MSPTDRSDVCEAALHEFCRAIECQCTCHSASLQSDVAVSPPCVEDQPRPDWANGQLRRQR